MLQVRGPANRESATIQRRQKVRQVYLTLCALLALSAAAKSAANPIEKEAAAGRSAEGSAVNLFYTDELLGRMRSRIEQDDWACTIWDAQLKMARDWVALQLEIPTTGGGYYHDYACPQDGARLQFDPLRPHEHYCPACKRYLTGPELDAYWVAIVHANNFAMSTTLALNACLFGTSGDAQWAKDTLLYYARHYADYPVHGNRAGQGKIFFQSLDESVNLLKAAATYELLARGDLTTDEARIVREQLFGPGSALVRQFDFGIHNIQCWQAAFLLAAAVICDNQPLRDEALASLEENLTLGITPEGWWYEGSPGYHFYTLRALSRFAIPAKHNAVSPPHTSRMVEMLLAPYRVAYPNLELPAINDSEVTSLANLAPYLEAATYLFGDPRLDAALEQLYESGKTSRASLEALCYGPDSPTSGHTFAQRSERLDYAGMVILRRPRTNLYALIRSGLYQGIHDHPDRLNLIVYGLGKELAPDLGACAYGLPLLSWYTSTVAHNTLVVNEQSQDLVLSDAQCVFFDDRRDFAAGAVRATRLYPGVEMSRTVVALDDALIDYYRARSNDVEITMDWVYHNAGHMLADLPAATSPSTLPSYQYLEEIQAYQPADCATLTWEVEGGKVVLTLLDLNGAELFTARGPGFLGQEEMSLAIVRRRGQSGDFVSVIQIVGDGEQPRPVSILEHNTDRIVVRLSGWLEAATYELTPNSARRWTTGVRRFRSWR